MTNGSLVLTTMYYALAKGFGLNPFHRIVAQLLMTYFLSISAVMRKLCLLPFMTKASSKNWILDILFGSSVYSSEVANKICDLHPYLLIHMHQWLKQELFWQIPIQEWKFCEEIFWLHGFSISLLKLVIIDMTWGGSPNPPTRTHTHTRQ